MGLGKMVGFQAIFDANVHAFYLRRELTHHKQPAPDNGIVYRSTRPVRILHGDAAVPETSDQAC